ncbi:protein TonB [Rhodobacter aestuarii]|uniref:Protein TonB n=1 Tax=Rhodobacter aestuarii TaxID=453582 RepID=A0A1N7P4Y4_9RHOB|nr:energy transducer TonB [Rhodobacter aestuarii]PTV97574.1 protein TonB [Rhodobacter aestuarii]SIT05489.1 protein TonB [Rhodobacter aestuarii]
MSLALGAERPASGGRVVLLGLGLSLALHGAVMAGFGARTVVPEGAEAAGAGGAELASLAAVAFVDLMPEMRLPAPAMVLPLAPPVVAAPDPLRLAEPAQEVPRKPMPKPRAKPEIQAEMRAESRAAGQGGGVQAGRKAPAAARASLAPGQEQSLLRQWGAELRARIERRKSYPKAAGRASGRVVVQVTVGRDGRLIAAQVARSSGHAALDTAALSAVKRAGRFPAAPKGLSKPSYGFAVPISFAR